MNPDEFREEMRKRILGPKPSFLDRLDELAKWATKIIRPFADGPYTPAAVAGKPEYRGETFHVIDVGNGLGGYRLNDAPTVVLDYIELLQLVRVARIQLEDPAEQEALHVQSKRIEELVKHIIDVRPLQARAMKHSLAQGARRRGRM